MYEYSFLTPDRGAGFVERVRALGLEVEVKPDPISDDATTVRIRDDIDDATYDKIECWYEEETAAAEAELMAMDGDDHFVAAGVWVQLENGGSSLARVDPAVMKKMLTVISHEELADFVARVADAVEHPDITPICHTTPEDSA